MAGVLSYTMVSISCFTNYKIKDSTKTDLCIFKNINKQLWPHFTSGLSHCYNLLNIQYHGSTGETPNSFDQQRLCVCRKSNRVHTERQQATADTREHSHSMAGNLKIPDLLVLFQWEAQMTGKGSQ